MLEGFWNIIPIDSAEAMSTYSAIGFAALIIVCYFLYRQNNEQKKSIEALEKDVEDKEKELRAHTDSEADKLHKRIERGLTNNSNDLKEVKGTMCRVENTVIKQTANTDNMIKTIDEIKKTIEYIRNNKLDRR